MVLGGMRTAFAAPADSLSVSGTANLSGFTIGIDPGHQETADLALEAVAPGSVRTKARMTAGAFGVKTGIAEYQITLCIANKLKNLLEDYGATVILSRSEHDVNLSNAERAQMMNAYAVDCWVRIHCDYSSDNNKCGISALCPSEDANAACSAESLALAEAMLNAVCSMTGATKRVIALLSEQTAFHWSASPVVTIETGFLSNSAEEALLLRDAYQTALAEGMCKGLMDHLVA